MQNGIAARRLPQPVLCPAHQVHDTTRPGTACRRPRRPGRAAGRNPQLLASGRRERMGGMDTERFLAAADELLAVPSTADRPDELHRALGFVLDFVGPGFTVERFESGGKPSALVYRGGERPRFQVILNGHLDVVPAPPAQFRPRREGDRLYARGAQDMKVSALVEAQVFRELGGGLPYPLALQL